MYERKSEPGTRPDLLGCEEQPLHGLEGAFPADWGVAYRRAAAADSGRNHMAKAGKVSSAETGSGFACGG